jgi:asparagine synthase (glutamine-hydrolysing)
MCGIAGGFSNKKLDGQALQQATDRLSHRGPDASGYYMNDTDRLFLGHRRLSILDLSEGANQPMYTADGRYVMVYNGELYNYTSLSNKLPGFAWKTTGDSEVILELFAAFGTKSFAWLNGMFAIAIYDILEDKLYLCRDQVGIKPLFYYRDDDTLVFGSELKVVVTHSKLTGIEKLEINKEAIPYFLHLGFIPEPHTIYQQVYKFPSAHYSVLDCQNNDLQFYRFWSAEKHFLTDPVIAEQKALATYQHLLFDVIESQMISDVPLGTFLSGGIDSSLVTAVASKISTQKVKSFSIGFNEPQYDESAYAEDIAAHLGTEHHTFKVSVDDILDLIPSLLEVYDEPYADSSAFPTMLVSRLARKHVTVTLSGDGGDELFQGYGMYAWANRLDQPFNKIMRKPIYHLTQMGSNRYKRAAELFDYPSHKRLHTHIFSQEQYFFGEKELNSLLIDNSYDFENINKLDVPQNSSNAAEKQAFWDLKYYLKDDLLVKVDRASMQYSLECRVPLLDTRIVELGLNIDYRLKVREGYGTKYLMKKVLYDMVPRKLFERPKKGFAIPLKEWLQGPLAYLIDDFLNEEDVREQAIVSIDYVKDMLHQFRNGKDYLYNRIWLLVVLHWWLKQYKA